MAFHVGLRNACGRKANGRVFQIGQQMNPKKPDWLIEEEEDRKRTYMLDEVMCTRDREQEETEDES